MAKTTISAPAKKPHQKSLQVEPFFWRYGFRWNQPQWAEANAWRKIVRHQPTAMLCRETLIANILALDWKIEPRDSNQRDELKSQMDYYTKLFEHNGEIDWVSFIELICQDFLDIPFGTGIELGYENDDPSNDLIWFEPLDGATLFPTLNPEWPVAQVIREVTAVENQPVYFPRHAINRMYMTPRPEIQRKGWGMAPPEKIWRAIHMISMGDTYYANMLLDTPEAGILDLGDMEKSAAEEWVASFKTLMGGIDGFKVPILYEHTTQAKYIPFSRPPMDITFDRTITKYMSLVCAGYGMSLSDIGYQSVTSGGETLAGSIRQERKTRKTGFARLKKSLKYFMNRMLPDNLRFDWIDLDDELNVALGRARLSSATAYQQMIDSRLITPQEARLQAIADGLMTIPMKETLDESDFAELPEEGGDSPERTGLLGRPRPPSEGGRGEVQKSKVDGLDNYLDIDVWKPVIKKAVPRVKNYLVEVFLALSGDDLDTWDQEFEYLLFESALANNLKVNISDLNTVEVPETLNTVSNLSETVEKCIIVAIKEHLIDEISKSKLDINDIIVDNTIQDKVIEDVRHYLSEIKTSIEEKINE